MPGPEDVLAPEGEAQEPDYENDVYLTPDGGRGSDAAVSEKEHRILSGAPVATIQMRNGKLLPVYPKPHAYFWQIHHAVNEYLEALVRYDRSPMPHGWRRWWRARRRTRSLDRIEAAEYKLLCLIFEDRYAPERNTPMTADDYLAMPHDLFLKVIDAYQDANNVEDILKRLIPNWSTVKKKDGSAIERNGQRL